MQSNLKSALPSTLTGSLREYRVVEGSDLLRRIEGFERGNTGASRKGSGPIPAPPTRGREQLCRLLTTSAARHRA